MAKARKGSQPNDGADIRLLTITAAAKELGLSRTIVHKLLDSGDLPYIRIRADRRIPRKALAEWIARKTTPRKD